MKSCIVAGLGLAILLSAAPALPAQPARDSTSLPSNISIAAANEPGAPLIVRGVIYKPDGVTPAPGVTVEIHHTDAEGWYHKASRNREKPRLLGLLKTDAQGRFEFRTIKPGKYPEGRNPAHIHFKAWGAGFDQQMPIELFFAGDSDLPPADRVPRSGKWNAVCSPTRDAAGALHCTYNIKLE
jgi:protocatechuate 3,4-dioxygenase beta subunit